MKTAIAAARGLGGARTVAEPVGDEQRSRRPADCSTAQASPHTCSPGIGHGDAADSQALRAPAALRGWPAMRATSDRAWPGGE